jgi:hypothetical protein
VSVFKGGELEINRNPLTKYLYKTYLSYSKSIITKPFSERTAWKGCLEGVCISVEDHSTDGWKLGRSKNWIRDRIAHAPVIHCNPTPQPVVIITDVTFFGRDSGLCVIRAPNWRRTSIYKKCTANQPRYIGREGLHWRDRDRLSKQLFSMEDRGSDRSSTIYLSRLSLPSKTDHHPLYYSTSESSWTRSPLACAQVGK